MLLKAYLRINCDYKSIREHLNTALKKDLDDGDVSEESKCFSVSSFFTKVFAAADYCDL